MYKITQEPIKPDDLHAWILKPHHGAVVTFAGTVRNNSEGRGTVRLEYETYAEMAEKKMAEIGQEIKDTWGIEAVAMIHRVGALEIGDISILIAVAAPHRKDTFDACAYAIDRVKQVVPVWKKEIWADGDAEWKGRA